jgi:hypothetical protein
MDTALSVVLVVSIAVLLAGIKLMYCGHRQRVRHDRRSTDRVTP